MHAPPADAARTGDETTAAETRNRARTRATDMAASELRGRRGESLLRGEFNASGWGTERKGKAAVLGGSSGAGSRGWRG